MYILYMQFILLATYIIYIIQVLCINKEVVQKSILGNIFIKFSFSQSTQKIGYQKEEKWTTVCVKCYVFICNTNNSRVRTPREHGRTGKAGVIKRLEQEAGRLSKTSKQELRSVRDRNFHGVRNQLCRLKQIIVKCLIFAKCLPGTRETR